MTSSVLSLKPPQGSTASIALSRTRRKISAKDIFFHIFDPIIEHITSATNTKFTHTKKHCSKQQITTLLATFVEICSTQVTIVNQYLRSNNRATTADMTTKQYNTLMGAIEFEIPTIIELFNNSLHSLLSVSGIGAVDEVIWPYQGESNHLIHIPRKPRSTGIRAFYHCFRMVESGLPVMYTLAPDMERVTLTPKSILDIMVKSVEPSTDIGIVADSYFSSAGWLQSKGHIPTTFSMSSNDLCQLTPLFTRDLQYRQHRMFTNDSFIVSVWRDNDTMICGTSAFKIESKSDPQLDDQSALKPYPRNISVAGMKHIEGLGLEDLKELAKGHGVSTGWC